MITLVIGGVVAVWVVVGGVALVKLRGGGKLQLEADGWASAARALQLEQRRAFFAPGLVLVGHHGEHEVKVTRIASQSGTGFSAAIRIGGVRGDVTVSPTCDPFAFELSGVIQTGDPDFDRTFEIAGPEELVRATFDDKTRRTALERTPRMAISKGQIELPLRDAPDGATLEILTRALLVLARRLSIRGDDFDGPICRVAATDPCAGVRRRCLAWLVACGAPDAAHVEALKPLLDDEDPEIRLFASQVIGEQACATLEALARDATCADRIRAAAFDGAVDFLASARRVALIADLVASSPPAALATELLRAIERDHLKRHAPFVRAHLDHADLHVRIAAAGAAGLVADASWVVDLIERLDDQESVVVEVCAALGCVGTAEAVNALRAAADASSRRATREAALQAIASIQSRAGEPGRLSVVGEDDAGAVSFAGDDGALSLERPED